MIIDVQDTGIGIAKEHLPFIFDQFFQVSRREGKRQKGSGLGLSIAKKSSTPTNGRIDVRSESGVGTTFTVRLPNAAAARKPVLRILVLGLGNDLYGDDGVGLHAVRRLRAELESGAGAFGPADGLDFAECLLSGVALLDVIRGYDAIVIIDTIVKPDPVLGRISLLDASDVREIPGPSPHYISVPQTLTLGKQLGLEMPKTVKIVAVEAKNLYCCGEGLSEAMMARLPAILDATKNVIRELGERPHKYLPTI